MMPEFYDENLFKSTSCFTHCVFNVRCLRKKNLITLYSKDRILPFLSLDIKYIALKNE
ncbi:hypothetical protein XNC1_0161 [Xenorhabdus nematophila ATCC 19061]|uniref:Uncharacterized protein n=1 Tax=Xenorhabdus nematophila (strain ATCC 19061 / DSM 3370 / CCUG 14189 / LMG 1036 / NCIMB 9965 / AN6) TaxID=406817 RepID=D3VGW4_XENNA|nr:hypothetical protein XNC1_0161 [Xenorhabdus nematophila ATCC 19061]